ncbi:MAG: hypothetical protein NC400_12670 [Clostridium sp.]|nr:hypothetical protein [Clostridium sp.]
MDNRNTKEDEYTSLEECEQEFSDTVFEIRNKEQQLYFLAWALNLSEQELEQGKDFLIEHNTSFKVLWKLFSHLDTYTVVIEDHYVDRVYRDSYYFYYSGKHFSYSRFCKRLCLFHGILEHDFYDFSCDELEKYFMGTIVIRPIPDRSIGRTLLNPRYFLPAGSSCQIRLADYNVTVYGKRLHVHAFPYGMQDGETTSCAEITILNLLDYYSQLYPEYHYLLPSEISSLAEMNSYERRMPTTGLSYELISKIFCDVGFYPRLYSIQKMTTIKFRHILHYYIESGIPVALGLKLGEENKHSVISIGHTVSHTDKLGTELTCAYDSESKNVIWTCDTADTVDTYCIMDDNRVPYKLSKCIEEAQETKQRPPLLKLNECEVEYMMVPLYKRMILEAADAYDICLSILASQRFGIKDFLQLDALSPELLAMDKSIEKVGIKEEPLVIRLFMASSRTFRRKRDEQFRTKNGEVRDWYNITVFPKFVWVCEFTTRTLYKEDLVLGEIIIDATSSADAKMDSFIIIHYPNVICRRMPEDFMETGSSEFEGIHDWHPFEAFHGNLENF